MEVSEDNSQLFSQFVKLGDMMGDGLHHEPDGKWIAKEYDKLAKILLPKYAEHQQRARQLKNAAINELMKKLLEGKNCQCGGVLAQKRSGAKVAYCTTCNQRYIAKQSKTT